MRTLKVHVDKKYLYLFWKPKVHENSKSSCAQKNNYACFELLFRFLKNTSDGVQPLVNLHVNLNKYNSVKQIQSKLPHPSNGKNIGPT